MFCRCVFVSLHQNKNIVWQKKVMISFFEPGNLIINIIGRAGVLRAPSYTHSLMHIIQIDLIIYIIKFKL
jgi:hypothetical protein